MTKNLLINQLIYWLAQSFISGFQVPTRLVVVYSSFGVKFSPIQLNWWASVCVFIYVCSENEDTPCNDMTP